MKKHYIVIAFLFFVVACGGTSCSGSSSPEGGGSISNDNGDGGGGGGGGNVASGDLIQPADLEYVGAFRLPDSSVEGDAQTFAWGGYAMAYYPDGDASGATDGYPGSLFITGTGAHNYVAEVGIPVPSSPNPKNVEGLNTASILQSRFYDVRAGLFNNLMDITRVGMEYLSKKGAQASGKLYFAWGQHYQEQGSSGFAPSIMWCDVSLAAPNTAGAWWVGNESLYSVNDYMFSAPQVWADTYTGGRSLLAGRYRDGGWSGQGPSLFAIGPWLDGNPPSNGTHLSDVTLLKYETSYEAVNNAYSEEGQFNSAAKTMTNYQHADSWVGGAWLESGDKSSVIFVGTKGTGEHCWYGDHVVMHHCTACNPEQGWWSDSFAAQIIFYNPADLANVAQGNTESSVPQPYATMTIDDRLFSQRHMIDPAFNSIPLTQQKDHVGSVAYDKTRKLLFISESFGDGEKPLIHVWHVK